MLRTFLCILSLSLTSCVLLFESNYQTIEFETNPSGAEVFSKETGKFIGMTPLSTPILKNKTHRFQIYKNGYEEREYVIYKGKLDVSKSPYCSIDFYYGWLLLGIPLYITETFAEDRCVFVYKPAFNADLKKIETKPIMQEAEPK